MNQTKVRNLAKAQRSTRGANPQVGGVLQKKMATRLFFGLDGALALFSIHQLLWRHPIISQRY